MAQRTPRDLSLTEWIVLALVAEGPSHGFAIAKELRADSDLGRVMTVQRALVYRALGDFFRGSPPDFDPEANRRVRDPQREAVVVWVRQRIGN